MADENPPPGWYSDPLSVTMLRYWDGGAWTDFVQGGSESGVRPSLTTPTPQPPVQTPVRGDSERVGRRNSRRKTKWIRWTAVGFGVLIIVLAGLFLVRSTVAVTERDVNSHRPRPVAGGRVSNAGATDATDGRDMQSELGADQLAERMFSSPLGGVDVQLFSKSEKKALSTCGDRGMTVTDVVGTDGSIPDRSWHVYVVAEQYSTILSPQQEHNLLKCRLKDSIGSANVNSSVEITHVDTSGEFTDHGGGTFLKLSGANVSGGVDQEQWSGFVGPSRVLTVICNNYSGSKKCKDLYIEARDRLVG